VARIDGRCTHFQVLARPIVGEDAAESWVLVIRDVNAAAGDGARVQQQERLAAVGNWLPGLRTILTTLCSHRVVRAMSERAENVPPRIRERLAIIQQQAMHATRLIQQILDFSRRAILSVAPLMCWRCCGTCDDVAADAAGIYQGHAGLHASVWRWLRH